MRQQNIPIGAFVDMYEDGGRVPQHSKAVRAAEPATFSRRPPGLCGSAP